MLMKITKKLTWGEVAGSLLGTANKAGYKKLRNDFSSRLDRFLAAIERISKGLSWKTLLSMDKTNFKYLNEWDSN